MVAVDSRKTKSYIRFSYCLSVWSSFFLIFSRTETSHGFVMPFGASHGDKQMNGQRENVQLNEGINFLGKVYSSVELMENGLIRFLESSKEPENHIEDVKPQILPLDLSIPFVAAFWTDPTLTNKGTIWFKKETNSTELTILEKLISTSFLSSKQQKVKWAFVVTWEDVAFIKHSGNNSQQNTFQAALLLIEDKLFLIYNYITLTWGDWKQMPELNQNSSAVAGYDGGDRNNFLMLSRPGPNDIITGSNVNISGLWIFRVDRNICFQKDMTLIVVLATIMAMLIGIVAGVLCTCFCLRKMKKEKEDTQPLDDYAEPPATIKSSEQLSILPPSNPDAPAFPTYEANLNVSPAAPVFATYEPSVNVNPDAPVVPSYATNLNVNPDYKKPPPRKIRVIKKHPEMN